MRSQSKLKQPKQPKQLKPSTPTAPTTPCGIPGISYSLSFTKNLHTNASALAGVLNLPSTSALWNLYTSATSSTKPILDAWTTERTQYKSAISLRGVRDTKLLALSQNPVYHVIITSDMHPAFNVAKNSVKAGEKVTGTNLVYLAGLWYIGRLIRAAPELFPKSRLPAASGKGDGNGDVDATVKVKLDPYDVLHGWKLLKWVWAVAYPSVAAGLKNTRKDREATKPVWHVQRKTEVEDDAGKGDEGTIATKQDEGADEDTADTITNKGNQATAGAEGVKDEPAYETEESLAKKEDNEIDRIIKRALTDEGDNNNDDEADKHEAKKVKIC
ncbi:hypothetical protein BDW74DRAFT_182222 [Aspergillus multicolor]|uniref:uncharacterized protein n=1 Tax=Aspergillus multicolor TaxID=41759 RepID=UPI003CCDD40C